ncbi:ketol-acid reductoisomerase [Sphingomonas mesophila]|uniref:ketol-acid reductoisomerase n=1 Tax=Sphingomonas mesophila TaxID=2303576 RepID=UPI0013C33B71|nr:ketol-acid reductoisomerase [Sphingomonas mesophila]
MHRLTDKDIDLAPLAGRRIAVIGYGNQGRAQAQNLADGGFDVVVGLRGGSARASTVAEDGLSSAPLEDAVDGADVVMLLVPDEAMAGVYGTIAGRLKAGSALGFSHGLAVHFGFVAPRFDLDVFLVAPKGPGSALRSLFAAGDGMLALWAVGQDASGGAREIALAYGRAIGCGRAGLIESSFAEECEADLFNEGAVVWGAVPELLIAGFDTLVEAGVRPEVAYLECVGELKLLADLIEARGIAGMRAAISNTAELGAVLGGPAVIDDGVRERMRAVLSGIRSGAFAAALKDEEASGYPRLKSARERARSLAVEAVRRSLDS